MPNYTQGGPAFCSVWLYPRENTQLPSDSVIGSLEWVKYPASTIDWPIRGTTSRSNHDTQPWYVGYLSRPLTRRSLNSWSLYQPGVTKEVLDLLSFIDLRDGWGRKNQTYVVFLASSACWFFFFYSSSKWLKTFFSCFPRAVEKCWWSAQWEKKDRHPSFHFSSSKEGPGQSLFQSIEYKLQVTKIDP